jgi:hypothetical protein
LDADPAPSVSARERTAQRHRDGEHQDAGPVQESGKDSSRPGRYGGQKEPGDHLEEE